MVKPMDQETIAIEKVVTVLKKGLAVEGHTERGQLWSGGRRHGGSGAAEGEHGQEGDRVGRLAIACLQ